MGEAHGRDLAELENAEDLEELQRLQHAHEAQPPARVRVVRAREALEPRVVLDKRDGHGGQDVKEQ